MTIKISYEPFDHLIVCLRNDGLQKEAELLHHMIYKIGWTTGSELIGELGSEIKKIHQKHNINLSEGTKNQIVKAMEMVKCIWPDFPK